MDLEIELEKIKSQDIRNFTKQALLKADPMFWRAPCSSSGKYHPAEDQIEGGLIVHCKKGIVVVEQFGRRANFDGREMDCSVSAFLLHDVQKNGIPWGKDTDYTHGLVASRWLEQFELEDAAAKKIIMDAVRYHMAPWCYAVGPFEDRPYSKDEMQLNWQELSRALVCPSRVELAVREADYWSSRQNMSFLPDKQVVFDPRVHDTPRAWLESFAQEQGLKLADK